MSTTSGSVRYGKWKTVYSRWLRWRDSGVWQRIWDALQQETDHQGEVEWEIHFIDSTIVRAHQHAAGAKSIAEAEGLGTESRWAERQRVHARVDGKGRPFTSPSRPVNSMTRLMQKTLLKHGAVHSGKRGRPPSAPPAFLGRRQGLWLTHVQAVPPATGYTTGHTEETQPETRSSTQCHSVSGAEYRGALFLSVKTLSCGCYSL